MENIKQPEVSQIDKPILLLPPLNQDAGLVGLHLEMLPCTIVDNNVKLLIWHCTAPRVIKKLGGVVKCTLDVEYACTSRPGLKLDRPASSIHPASLIPAIHSMLFMYDQSDISRN